MSEKERNIENLCRICLQDLPRRAASVLRFTDFLPDFNVSYEDAFKTTTGHLVLANEPQSLCKKCSEMIFFAYKLKKVSEETQSALEELLPKIDVALLKVEMDDFEPTEAFADEKVAESESEGSDKDDFEEKTLFKCDFCVKTFHVRGSLNAHLKEKHASEHAFECEHCKKRYLTEKQLDTHQRYCIKRPKASGESRQKYICPFCGILANKDHIKSHEKAEEAQQQTFICDLCGATMSSRTTINNHMRFQHLNIRPKCRHCGNTFKNPSSLARHIRRHHRKTKTMRCRQCNFTTTKESELRRHRYAHTGRKTIKCEVCGLEFIQKHKLKIHMASHSDERPFHCDTCGSAFKTRKGLGAHKKTHKAYDYECPVCQRAYLTNQLMRSHAEKNHPEYQLPPPGTIFSKSWIKRMAEQKIKDMEELDGVKPEEIVTQDLTQVQYFQPYFKY
ncbi:zinc finger protein 668-like [Culicoides brevitarsis]|uniref:zinc finger protein 668-like n=1 Tax=Culicoides brevitarsis TaxID=469753 RepID=UPI00307B434B